MQTPNPKYISVLRRTVKESPYPSHMRMTLENIAFDRAQVRIQIDHCHLQPFGIVHGGVLATIIDTATFWAAFLRLPEETGLVNVDLKLNYLETVTAGKIVAEGVCIRPGKQVSYAEAKVYDQNERLVAHGTSTLMALPGKGLDLGCRKFI